MTSSARCASCRESDVSAIRQCLTTLRGLAQVWFNQERSLAVLANQQVGRMRPAVVLSAVGLPQRSSQLAGSGASHDSGASAWRKPQA